MESFKFYIGAIPEMESIIEVYRSSGITRPVEDIERIMKMYHHSNLIVSAFMGEQLIGIARAMTDFNYVCYLSDLAVKKEFQRSGVGKKILEIISNELGDKVSLILTSSPSAMNYYPKMGFEKINNGFLIRRKF